MHSSLQGGRHRLSESLQKVSWGFDRFHYLIVKITKSDVLTLLDPFKFLTASRVCLNENKVPFFARMSEEKKQDESPKPVSEDDEIEQLVREELNKTKKISNLRNAQG